MKAVFYTLAGVSALSCTTNSNKIGVNDDGHGCNAAAGQTWSVLENDCIFVFNSALRLNPVVKNQSGAEISAFVLLNEENSKAEIFLPDSETDASVILNRTDADIFTNGTYRYDSKNRSLYKSGKLIYKAD